MHAKSIAKTYTADSFAEGPSPLLESSSKRCYAMTNTARQNGKRLLNRHGCRGATSTLKLTSIEKEHVPEKYDAYIKAWKKGHAIRYE